MAISQADVQKQIQHMMAFIEQEAQEKAEEIETKAEEEFEIEKGKLVNEQRMKIIDFFEKKEKQVEIQRKIQNSHMQQSARLRLLKAREDHIRGIIEEARQKLVDVTKDTNMYSKVLQKLIAQCAFQLLEEKVIVRCRQQDVSLVQSIIKQVEEEYRNATNKKIEVIVDTEKHLSQDACGGVEVVSKNGKIKCNNTLENRLYAITQHTLPMIRAELFGPNPNRKHHD